MKYISSVLLFISLMSSTALAENANEYYEKALSSSRLGKVDEAFIYLKNALQQNENHLPARVLMGELYFKKGDLFSTEEILSEALANGADVNLVIYYLGYALLGQSKFETMLALDKYETQLTRSNRFEWVLLKAQAYERLDNTLYAQGFYADAIQLSPFETKALNAYASFLVQQADFQKSKELIERSFELSPENAKTWSLQGEWFLKQRNITKGLEALNQAYKHDPEDAKVLRLLAFTNMKIGDFETAELYLTQISELFPEDASTTLMKAWLLSNKNKQELAQESLDNLDMRLTLFTDQQLIENDTIHYLKGSSEFIKGNFEQARNSLLTFLTSNQSHFSSIQMLTQIYQELEGDSAATKFLDSKRYAIVEHLPLSIQLVEFYINSGQLYAAREFLTLLQSEHKDNVYVNYVSALVDKARGLPKSAVTYIERIPPNEQEQFDVSLLKAELLVDIGRFDEAKQIIDRLTKSNAGEQKLLYLKGTMYLKVNNYEQAQSSFEQVLDKSPNNYLAKYNLAIAFVKQNKVNSAIQQLEQVLLLQKSHSESRVMLAKHLFLQGRVEQALSHAIVLSNDREAYVQGHELLSRIYMSKNQWQKAYDSTYKLLQENNLNDSYIADHIRVLNGLDQQKEANRYLKILTGLWSDDWQRLFQLSRLYELVGNKPTSIDKLNAAIALKPDTPAPYLYLIQLLLSENNQDKAEKTIKLAESQFGQSSSLYILKGDLKLLQTKANSALLNYQRALKANDRSDIALIKMYQLAKAGTGGNEFSDLMEQRKKAEKLKPWHKKLLADHYLNQGESKLAIAAYEELLSANDQLSNDVSILNNLANLYVDDKPELALNYALKAYTSNDKNPVVLDTYGWVLAKMNKFDEALPILRNASNMDALNPEINYHLAYVLAKLGRVDDAKFELNKALEAKNFAYKDEAESLLKSL